MKKIKSGIAVLIFFIFAGCSQMENNSNEIEAKDYPIGAISSIRESLERSGKSAEEILNELANENFSIEKDRINEDDYEAIVTFGKAFVNLYTGAVAEQEVVSFENYISNENLLKFTNKMLELEQKREFLGGIGVIFGLENEFNKAELKKLDENLCYLRLQFSNQGSGMNCRLLVQCENRTLKIVDLYFGNKDGADTIATGHPAVRKLDDPGLWDDRKWVEDVFEKLEKYEDELIS